MNIISNIISNSVSGLVEAGTRTVGGYAGDALIRAGDMIEDKGAGVGRSAYRVPLCLDAELTNFPGLENAAAGYGTKISGQAPAPGALGGLPKAPVPKKKPLQRSNSTPAASLPSASKAKALPSTAASAATATANKAGSAAAGSAKKATSTARLPSTALPKTAIGGVRGAVGGPLSEKAESDTEAQRRKQRKKKKTRELPKPYPNSVPYPTAKAALPEAKKAPSSVKGNVNGAKNNVNGAKDKESSDNKSKGPRPYPYPESSSYPTDKKMAVKPGKPRPFVAPSQPAQSSNNSSSTTNAKTGANGVQNAANNKDVKAYPGTSTLPGQGTRTPVRQQKYKPAERYQPSAERGKVQHIGIEA